MEKKWTKFLLSLMVLIILASSAYCQDSTPTEENKTVQLPQWVLYMRRTEIVTLGSLPFTTLGVTLGFGAYKYFSGATNSFPNPFDKSTSAYTGDDMKIILGISISISAAIGIADLIVSIVKHNNEAKRLERLDTASIITIVPATEEEIENFRRSQGLGESSTDEEKSEQPEE